MHPAIPHLIELQRVDHQIAALRAELEAFPKRIREADAKLSGARAELAAAKETHTQGATERKKLEFDVQQWKDRARKYRDQSGAVKTNESFKALQHEIANAEAEVAKAENGGVQVERGRAGRRGGTKRDSGAWGGEEKAARSHACRARADHCSRAARFARSLRAYRQAP